MRHISRVALVGLVALGIVSYAARADEALWIEGEDYTVSSFNEAAWGGGSWYHDDNISRDLLAPGVPGVSEGNWHSTYGNNNTVTASYTFIVTEGGAYTWWIRLNPFRNQSGGANYTYQIDSGSWQSLDVSESRDH